MGNLWLGQAAIARVELPGVSAAPFCWSHKRGQNNAVLSTPEDTSVCVRACRGFSCTRSPSRLVLGPKFPVSELLLPLHSAPCGGPGIPRQARSECSTLPVSVAVQEHTLCSAQGEFLPMKTKPFHSSLVLNYSINNAAGAIPGPAHAAALTHLCSPAPASSSGCGARMQRRALCGSGDVS